MAKKQQPPAKKPPISEQDQTTWKVFTVAALILGAVFAWQALKGTSPAEAPKPADAPAAVSAPAAAEPAPAKASVTERGKNAKGRQLPPDFALPEIFSHKEIKLSAYKGKVVLVDFWATWCGPCRMEIPHFVELHQAYKNKGFSVIGISVDQQGDETVQAFAKQWKINYPMIHDQQGDVGMAYGGIRSIPTTLLIGKDGGVITSFVGYRPKEVFEQEIKKALAAPL
jgi:thiol-disulfide isomerase/thioredoxin